MSSTSIGIIGAGKIGQAMALMALRAGRTVVMSNSRGPDSLSSTVAGLGDGVTAGTVAEAAAARIVVLAVPWSALESAVAGLTWSGQIVLDTNNAMSVTFDDGGVPTFIAADLHGRTSTEIVAELVPGARVVKAGNTLPAERLGETPSHDGGRRVLFISGDEPNAKAEVASLFEDAGYSAVDLGGLEEGGRLQQAPGGPLAGRTLLDIT